MICEYSAGMQRIDNEESYEARIWPDVPLSVNRWVDPAPPIEFLQARTALVASENPVRPTWRDDATNEDRQTGEEL